MPFAMIHLNIAKNIIDRSDQIKEPEQFLLGSIAPDAVHYIEGYHSDMKRKSHYCVGDEPWGCVTNNEEWISHVVENINKHKNTKNADFYLGYFTHILTDIQNNMRIWQPFKEHIKDSKEAGIGKKYHEESEKIDVILHQRSDNSIKQILSKATSIGTDELDKEAIEALRNEFIHIRCDNVGKLKVDVSNNEYVKLDEVDIFVDEVSDYIHTILFG